MAARSYRGAPCLLNHLGFSVDENGDENGSRFPSVVPFSLLSPTSNSTDLDIMPLFMSLFPWLVDADRHAVGDLGQIAAALHPDLHGVPVGAGDGTTLVLRSSRIFMAFSPSPAYLDYMFINVLFRLRFR